MKPFNLELDKAGESVCTDEGRDVRIVCFDRKDNAFKLVALVSDESGHYENYETYTDEGLYHRNSGCASDLRMKPIIKVGWINVYPEKVTRIDAIAKTGGMVYLTSNMAEKAGGNTATQIEIKWEEE